MHGDTLFHACYASVRMKRICKNLVKGIKIFRLNLMVCKVRGLLLNLLSMAYEIAIYLYVTVIIHASVKF